MTDKRQVGYKINPLPEALSPDWDIIDMDIVVGAGSGDLKPYYPSDNGEE